MNDHASLTPVPVFYWAFGEPAGRPEEATLIELLRQIADTGSVAAAARLMGVSYRHAWGLLERWRERLGVPLVDMRRGQGSRLTPVAARFVAADAQLREHLGPHFAAAREAMTEALAGAEAAHRQRIAVCASHDFALQILVQRMGAAGWMLDVETRGSLESLSEYAAGRCRMAGFHCPDGAVGAALWSRYRKHLDPRRDLLLHLARRRQGLLVAPGNPLRLAGIADLTRPGLRFVNRQKGAGTRLLLDEMLAAEGIATASIAGYGRIEYTHAAVGALVASGDADAALGVEEAARHFGLDFVPLIDETYHLVLRHEEEGAAWLEALAAILADGSFRLAAAALAGYGTGRSGERESIPTQADAAKQRRPALE